MLKSGLSKLLTHSPLSTQRTVFAHTHACTHTFGVPIATLSLIFSSSRLFRLFLQDDRRKIKFKLRCFYASSCAILLRRPVWLFVRSLLFLEHYELGVGVNVRHLHLDKILLGGRITIAHRIPPGNSTNKDSVKLIIVIILLFCCFVY